MTQMITDQCRIVKVLMEIVERCDFNGCRIDVYISAILYKIMKYREQTRLFEDHKDVMLKWELS